MASNPVILLCVANPQGDLSGVGQEFKQILSTLEPTGLVKPLPYASLEDILKALQDHREQMVIFHFGGHANQLGLLLETAQGGALALAGGLARFLSAQSSLKLLFLNGCSTQPQIQAFHEAGIPLVIGTKQPIPDAGATQFAAWFYRSLASGATLEQAFREAQGALEAGLGQTREFDTTTIAPTNSSDLWLISAKEETAKQWSLANALNDPLFGLPPLPQRDLPAKPYKHLSYFTEAEAELFFGRGWETRDLYFRVTTPTSDPLLLLYGQSGVGKSSLLDAGLTPRLRAKGYEVRYLRRDAGLGLVGTLTKALEADTSLNLAWKNLEAKLQKPLVVILDQLEEAFTRQNPKQAQEELNQLAQSLYALFAKREERPQGKLILSFRKEWLAEIETALSPNAAFLSKLRPLEALNLAGIQEAILGPSQNQRLQGKYNLSIAPDLPAEMAQDLLDHNSPIAPTLQLTLTKMWDRASNWDELHHIARNIPPYIFDHPLYQAFKQKGLGEILEQQLAELENTLPEAVKSGLALDLLHFHTTPQGTAEQRSEEDLQKEYGLERAEQIGALVRESKSKYLLTDPAGGQIKGTRLSHDTLAPYVLERFEKSQLPGQRARRILENRAVDWGGNKVGTPLDDFDLGLVEAGRAGMRAFKDEETHLFEASIGQRQRLGQEAEDRQNQLAQAAAAQEQERLAKEGEKTLRLKQQARSLVQFRWFSLGLVALVLIASSAAWFANGRGKLATANQYLAQANLQEPEKYDLAVLLNLEANRIVTSFQTTQQLSNFLFGPKALGYRLETLLSAENLLPGAQVEVVGLAFSPDGQYLASANLDAHVLVWDLRTRAHQTLQGLEGQKNLSETLGKQTDQVAFSPDGKLLAAGGWNGNIAIWEVSDHQYRLRCPMEPVTTAKDSNHHVTSMAFSADSTAVVSGHSDGSLALWNTECQPLAVPESAVSTHSKVKAVSFSQKGDQVFAAEEKGYVRCLRTSPPWTWEKGSLKLEKRQDSNITSQFNIAKPDSMEGSMVVGAAFTSYGAEVAIGLKGAKGTEGSGRFEKVSGCSWRGSVNALGATGFAFDSSRRRWIVAEVSLLRDWEGSSLGKHPRDITSLAVNPQSGLLAAGDELGRILLWNIKPDYANPSISQNLAPDQLRARACRLTSSGALEKADKPTQKQLGLDVYERNCPK